MKKVEDLAKASITRQKIHKNHGKPKAARAANAVPSSSNQDPDSIELHQLSIQNSAESGRKA